MVYNVNMYKLEIYTPKEFSLKIIKEISLLGAAKLGNYDNVASITEVMGHWRPLEGSDPFSGEVGKLQIEKEDKIETICPKEVLTSVLKRIKEVHPYEEPLINIIKLEV